MAYILFKNLNPTQRQSVIAFLESVSTNSNFGPDRDEAVGVCTTTYTNQYTYLNEDMCTKTNIYTSWILSRKECLTVEQFIKMVNEQIEEYEIYYKKLNERYQ